MNRPIAFASCLCQAPQRIGDPPEAGSNAVGRGATKAATKSAVFGGDGTTRVGGRASRVRFDRVSQKDNETDVLEYHFFRVEEMR